MTSCNPLSSFKLVAITLTSGLSDLASSIIEHLETKDDLFIPDYEPVFRQVLERYHQDFRAEGLHSYEFKLKRIQCSDYQLD